MAEVDLSENSIHLKNPPFWEQERVSIYTENEWRVVIGAIISLFSLSISGASFYKYKKTVPFQNIKYLYISISVIALISSLSVALIAAIKFYTLKKWESESTRYLNKYSELARTISFVTKNSYKGIFDELHKCNFEKEILYANEWDLKNKTQVGPFRRYWNWINARRYPYHTGRPSWGENGSV
ncbi:MAG: hypothetical protein SNF33_07150 [Candidatus Algichlamydia australiensis]|nr:hypothetical protein [Chlamydiales bacterium]